VAKPILVNATKALAKTINAPDGQPNGQIEDAGCPNQTNTCNDPNSTHEMYRIWWYSADVTLSNCGEWVLSVNNVDRDNSGTNMLSIGYPYNNLYVEAHINTLLAPKQSSPYTTVSAPVYATAGNPFHFNYGVTDPNGDALVYRFVQPMSAQADVTVVCAGYSPSNLNFASPFLNSVNNPLFCNNTFTLNTQNGDIDFTPANAQNAYLAYKVEKYRNGQLIGSIMMDNKLQVLAGATPPMQVNVNAASVTGGTLSGDTLVVCSNAAIAFCFNASSTTATAQLQASDNHFFVMKNATVNYTSQGTANVTGCVSWTPHLADVGFKYFIVKVKDMSCGVPVFQTYRIPVLIKQGAEIFARDTIVCPGASTKLTGTGGTSHTWTAVPAAIFSCGTCDTTVISPSANTLVTLTSNNNNGCTNTDTITINIDHSNSVNATPDTTVFCDGIGAYVNFAATASGPGPLKTAACGTYSPQSSSNLTDINMMQSSGNSFSGTLYYGYNIFWGPFYQSFYTQKSQSIFRKEELVAAGMQSGTIQKIALNFATNPTNVNPTFYNVKIQLRCTDKTQFSSNISSEFETGLSQVFTAASVTIHPGINEFVLTVPYDYDTSKNLNVQFCYGGVTPQTATTTAGGNTNLPIYYVPTPYTSYISVGQIGVGNACNTSVGSIRIDSRRPDMRFTVSPLPAGNFQYIWTPATGMSNPGAATTGVNVNHSTWFTVSTQGKLGCVVKDSVYVYVADNHFDLYPKESNVCDGDVVQLNATGGYKYNWYTDNFTAPPAFSCNPCDVPNVGPLPIGTHNFEMIASDAFGCTDTLPATINVSGYPTTNIINNDTTINFGESTQLVATGAAYYIWSPIGSLSSNNIYDPIASPATSTLYKVTGYAIGGCSTTDSVWVKVNIVEEAFIPNAFTPNGDGLNDVFKIGNLTFQRIVSFNIFDRWGNHVYEAGPNQNGWDGTYKGKSVPMDTYFYSIVLELPNGKVKNYKGDLTLIK
jgi:gliding motility-associated-like protein